MLVVEEEIGELMIHGNTLFGPAPGAEGCLSVGSLVIVGPPAVRGGGEPPPGEPPGGPPVTYTMVCLEAGPISIQTRE